MKWRSIRGSISETRSRSYSGYHEPCPYCGQTPSCRCCGSTELSHSCTGPSLQSYSVSTESVGCVTGAESLRFAVSELRLSVTLLQNRLDQLETIASQLTSRRERVRE
jgi:hypothetical protein